MTFELRHAQNEDQVLAYVKSSTIWDDKFDIYNTAGEVVAHINRDFNITTWKWEMRINQPNHPGSDPRVLSSIAGRVAFAP